MLVLKLILSPIVLYNNKKLTIINYLQQGILTRNIQRYNTENL